MSNNGKHRHEQNTKNTSPEKLYSSYADEDISKNTCNCRNGVSIKEVKFNGPATIVFWSDGTKTVVKCNNNCEFDPYYGIAVCCAKKLLGNTPNFNTQINKAVENSNYSSILRSKFGFLLYLMEEHDRKYGKS
jgi:hypothetical protein